MTDKEKLSKKEKLELAIQTGLQVIPTIGPPLSAAYFGHKQEKRFKRIESFYEEFARFAREVEYRFASIHSHDENELIAIIEEFNEKLEREHTEKKREYFKHYLKNTLIEPVNGNFDERKFFIDALADLTLLECELLTFFSQSTKPIISETVSKPGVDPNLISGSIQRLKNYGFIKAETRSITISNVGGNISEILSLSVFGKSFVDFCLVD